MNTTIYINKENSLTDEVDLESSDPEHGSNNIILTIMWKHNKMVASYYNIDQKLLYTIMETIDTPPKFQATEALLRQTQPKHIITIGKITDQYVQALIGLVLTDEGNKISGQYDTLPAKMTLLNYKEYTFNACLYRLRNLHLQSQPAESQPNDRLNYIQTLINVNSTKTVYTLGALIKFLEQAWHSLRTNANDDLIFLHLKQNALENHVYMDQTTFDALNVFNQLKHDSTFKHGGASSSREGFSLFKLLSQHCVSKLGLLKLREMLISPIKHIDELGKRYEFMDFIIDPRNAQIASSVNVALRKVTNINKIFGIIKHSQGKNGHWKSLYNTIYALLQVNEGIKPFLRCSYLLREYHDTITENLYKLEACINGTFDLNARIYHDRLVVKEDLDTELDLAKNKYQTIKNRLVAAARIVMNHLPPHLEECTVMYIPDIGHVLGVRRWSKDCQKDDLVQYGCYYLFETSDVLYYKNALCQELDNQLGDLPTEIQNHENRIIQRVAAFVVNENAVVMEPLEKLAYIDALISMAKVGIERSYIRPLFNAHNVLEIKDGRHPLAEMSDISFVPNHYSSGGNVHKSMKIITGPNASGKSMYLKQTALIVYMAHIGSYVPATAANISPVHSIHLRLHASESAALNLSAFMVDVFQMGNALYNAKPSSLVVMDEFGRGTTENVSKALLLGALRGFLNNDVGSCPHVLVSTHLSLEKDYLSSPHTHFQKMSHMRDEESGAITFLYKIEDGESSSFTFEMAADILDEHIVDRAKLVYNSLVCDKPDGTTKEELEVLHNINFPPFDD